MRANLLLRTRYGDWPDIAGGLRILWRLWRRPPAEASKREVRGALIQALRDAPHFVRTRKKSALEFGFDGRNYASRREGAFVESPRGGVATLGEQAPLATVIVRTVAGRGQHLERAVASVLHQTYPNVELVVVEDGSSEAEPLVQALRQAEHRTALHYWSAPRGAGRTRAANAGLRIARGRYVCFLDDDDLLLADHLESLIDLLRASPDHSAAYGLAYELATPADEPAGPGRRIRLLYRQEFSRVLLWHENYLPIQSVVFERQLYLDQGGFDERLDALEDWNLWARYGTHARFRLLPKVTSLYRVP